MIMSLCLQELKLPVYRGHSPQIGMRRYFADLLAILSNRYQLCPTARHLAVYLLDLFMDHYDVAVKQLYVIALTCLLLASKCICRLQLLVFVLLLRLVSHFCLIALHFLYFIVIRRQIPGSFCTADEGETLHGGRLYFVFLQCFRLVCVWCVTAQQSSRVSVLLAPLLPPYQQEPRLHV